MYSTADFEIIKDVVISFIPGAESVYLFGSYAKGTAREQSDIDIAILLEHDLHWRERNAVLNRLYSDMSQRGYNVDFVMKKSDKFRSESELPTLSRVILREGKLLWTHN
ncbi:MAG: nucleotidyltransferase domain-containing protein [Desulfuromonadaceae bacterium]|nr:nucleotidyltransferase domain-containing protein [Desulfuromonadaceae bacterium]MDD5107504.1 nucleotidyltransferase domain-containing protein [Desulfuromonadaceae bacterium]